MIACCWHLRIIFKWVFDEVPGTHPRLPVELRGALPMFDSQTGTGWGCPEVAPTQSRGCKRLLLDALHGGHVVHGPLRGTNVDAPPMEATSPMPE